MKIRVLDTNCLQSNDLRAYLAHRKDNVVAIADYCAVEIYKDADLLKLKKRMSVLSEYPEQVIILKSNFHACAQSGRLSGLRRRLIDQHQTENFPNFLKGIDQALRGDAHKQRSFQSHVNAAQEQMNRMLISAEDSLAAVKMFYQGFTPSQLAEIRAQQEMSVSLSKKVVSDILFVSNAFFSRRSDVRRPSSQELPYTYLFRVAMAMYFYTMDRARNGISPSLSRESVRNDMVDVYLVAYASLFDGMISSDKRPIRVYAQIKEALSAFLG